MSLLPFLFFVIFFCVFKSLFNLLQYVLGEVEKVKETAHFDVDVNVDFFESKSGVNRLVGGLFKGKSLVYSDISHIVVRIMPKYESEAGENAILVSSHIDTVFSTYVLCRFISYQLNFRIMCLFTWFVKCMKRWG